MVPTFQHLHAPATLRIAVKGLLTSLRHILRKHGGTASDPVALYGLIFSKRRLTSASVTGENSCRSGTLGKGMVMGRSVGLVGSHTKLAKVSARSESVALGKFFTRVRPDS